MAEDNHYDSGDDKAEKKSDSDSDYKDDKDGNTALLPKSFFRNKDDLKVGATEKIKILEEYEDEFLVECIYEKKDSKDKEGSSNDDRSDEMKSSESAMDGIMAA